MLWWSDELLRSPVANICDVAEDPPYAECLTDEARRIYESGSLGERVWARLRAVWDEPEQALDPQRVVARWRTARWQGELRTLLWRELGWTIAVWGPFALLAWAFAGFRSDSTPSPPDPGR